MTQITVSAVQLICHSLAHDPYSAEDLLAIREALLMRMASHPQPKPFPIEVKTGTAVRLGLDGDIVLDHHRVGATEGQQNVSKILDKGIDVGMAYYDAVVDEYIDNPEAWLNTHLKTLNKLVSRKAAIQYYVEWCTVTDNGHLTYKEIEAIVGGYLMSDEDALDALKLKSEVMLEYLGPGGHLRAAKLYRVRTGCSLLEAKKYVDVMRDECTSDPTTWFESHAHELAKYRRPDAVEFLRKITRSSPSESMRRLNEIQKSK